MTTKTTDSVLVFLLLLGSSIGLCAQAVDVPSPLTYESALELALARNLDLEAAKRQRAIREAAVRASRQMPNPDLTAESARDTPHQAVILGVPIEIGGKRARRIDLAREEVSLADADIQRTTRAVRRDVRTAFYSLVAANERVRLAEAALGIARGLREIAQARFDTGAAPRLEVMQADLGVARAEADLDLARSSETAFRATLNGVLNFPPQHALVVTANLYDHGSPPAYEQALRVAAVSNTDLTSLDRQIAVEQRRTDLFRAERVPTPIFSIGADLNAPPEFDVGPRVGISIGLPLFNRNQGEIAGSIATTLQLRGQRDATARAIDNALFGTLATIEAQRHRVEAYQQRLVPTAIELESLSEESYRAGRTSVLGVLDAQRSLRDLRDEALQAALDVQVTLGALEELIGTRVP
jgi:cobalt-zinc-cadmium efflux system outer membrane protein